MEKKEIESHIYLKLLKYVKDNGIYEINKFIKNLECLSNKDFIKDYLFHNYNSLEKLVKNPEYKEVVDFFRAEGNSLEKITIKDIKTNLETINSSIENLDLYIKNVKQFIRLGIDKIMFCQLDFCDFKYERFYNKDNTKELVALHKYYQNSDILGLHIFDDQNNECYQAYQVYFSNPNWVVETKNQYEEKKYHKNIYLNNLDVDLSNLPSKKEIESKSELPEMIRIIKFKTDNR